MVGFDGSVSAAHPGYAADVGVLAGEVRDVLCKYAEHAGVLAGAGGEHGVAELIYLMTERLISPQP